MISIELSDYEKEVNTARKEWFQLLKSNNHPQILDWIDKI